MTLLSLTDGGTLMYMSKVTHSVTILFAALGVAVAVDLLRLKRPRRCSSAEAPPSAPVSVEVDLRSSVLAGAPRPSPPAASADADTPPAVTIHRPEQGQALGYARVTRDANASELELHSEAIRAWCAHRELTLITIVHDVEAQPGDVGTTPALDWAIQRIAAGEAQTLVVATLRHVAISVSHLPPLLRWFAESDRRLVAIDLRLDTATEAGRLAAFALAGVGGWEHERLSARTRRGLEVARSRGAGRGAAAVGDVPELYQQIKRMREQGLTLQAIADALNEEGVPTLRGGARWRPSSVQRAVGYRRPAVQRGVALPAVNSTDGMRPAANAKPECVNAMHTQRDGRG
jgi:DNA invertase Pin-like site-specific DNA recombinase